MCFLQIIASCIVPFNRLDAGLVWKELVILFFMRVVKLLVMCRTAMEKGLLATSLLSTSVPSTFLYLCPVRYKSYRYFLKKLF